MYFHRCVLHYSEAIQSLHTPRSDIKTEEPRARSDIKTEEPRTLNLGTLVYSEFEFLLVIQPSKPQEPICAQTRP